MRTLVRLVPAALAALVLVSCAPPGSERVLATVGETRITAKQFESAVRREPSYLVDPTPDGKEVFLEQLIDRALLLDEARRRGFDQGEAFRYEVDAARGSAMSNALFDMVVSSRVWTTVAEVRALWSLRDREWRLSQIFTYERPVAESFLDRLEGGEPFEQVARSSAIEPGTQVRGGDIGYVTGGDMPGPIEHAVRTLEIGGWVGPTEDQLGFYFVKVTDIRARDRAPFESEKQMLETTLQMRKERALAIAFVRGLKARYHLRHVPEAYRVLAMRWQNRSTEDLFRTGASLDALGFTPEEQEMAIVRFEGGEYTVARFFDDLLHSSTANRPTVQVDPLLRLYIEDQVVTEILRREGERMRLEQEPSVAQAVRDRGESFLVNAVYEGVIVPEAAARYQASPPDADSLEDGEAERLFEDLRLAVLQETLTQLRSEHPPVIDHSALTRQPWPVSNQEKL